MLRGAESPVSQPRLVDHSGDQAPQPFNLCIANATPYLPRPAGAAGWDGGIGIAANSSRDCYFNEISLNVGARGRKGNEGGDGTNGLEEKDEPRQSGARSGDARDEMVSGELGRAER